MTLKSIVQDSDIMQFHSIIFKPIVCEAIRKAALKTDGSAGPSGVDAKGFRRICTSFGRHLMSYVGVCHVLQGE